MPSTASLSLRLAPLTYATNALLCASHYQFTSSCPSHMAKIQVFAPIGPSAIVSGHVSAKTAGNTTSLPASELLGRCFLCVCPSNAGQVPFSPHPGSGARMTSYPFGKFPTGPLGILRTMPYLDLLVLSPPQVSWYSFVMPALGKQKAERVPHVSGLVYTASQVQRIQGNLVRKKKKPRMGCTLFYIVSSGQQDYMAGLSLATKLNKKVCSRTFLCTD